MGGLKKFFPDIRFGGNKVTPDEIDRYETYTVISPTTSATWVGTAVAGTQTTSQALVLINARLDYPRNLLYGVVGTADIGGTWTVNGKNQFGESITESVGSGTVAAGTPAFAKSGTQIFAEVTSGTFTFATSAGQGSGSARLGVAIGGTAGSTAYFGLPTKIKAVSDVKRINWIKENVQTTLNGGTTTALVGTTYHTFNGTAVLGGTETFVVTMKSTYNNENGNDMANL